MKAIRFTTMQRTPETRTSKKFFGVCLLIALSTTGPAFGGDCPGRKRLICHIPPSDPGNAHEICIAPQAVDAHLAHGDFIGQPCETTAWSGSLRRLEAESLRPLEVQMVGTTPMFVSAMVPIPEELPDDPVIHSLYFLTRFKNFYRLENPEEQLYLGRIDREPITPGPDVPPGELRHMSFARKHNGVPIFGAHLTVHTVDDRMVVATSGYYIPEIPDSPPPVVSPSEAESLAVDLVDGMDKEVIGKARLMYVVPSLLHGAVTVGDNVRMAWRVALRGLRNSGIGTSWMAFIDAHDGSLVFSIDDLDADSTDLDLDIQTADFTTSRTCWDAPFVNDDVDWFNEDGATIWYPMPNDDPFDDGLDAYHLSRYIYDWFHDTAGYHMHSWDNDEEQVEIMVHVADPDTEDPMVRNAWFSPQCEHLKFGAGMVAMDIMAHEWTHAVDYYHGQIINSDMSGAMEESFCDISGAMVDDDDWLVGEDARGGALRDMANPPAIDGLPDHMSGYLDTEADDGGVHTNCGIPNKGFYLLANGGQHSGWQVEGIGRAKAGPLYFQTMRHDLLYVATFPYRSKYGGQPSPDVGPP